MHFYPALAGGSPYAIWDFKNIQTIDCNNNIFSYKNIYIKNHRAVASFIVRRRVVVSFIVAPLHRRVVVSSHHRVIHRRVRRRVVVMLSPHHRRCRVRRHRCTALSIK